METSVPASATVFISTPLTRQKYLGFLFHGHGPCIGWNALLAWEDCKDSALFAGSKQHKGHMYTVLFIETLLLLFLVSFFFPGSQEKLFVLRSILQEHIYKEIHELTSYWFLKKAKSVPVLSSVPCTELIHKASELKLTLIFDVTDCGSTGPSPVQWPLLSSHLTL